MFTIQVFSGAQGLHQCNVYRRSIFFPKTQRGFILFLLNLLNVVDTLLFWCPPFWRPAKMHLQSRSVKSIPLSLESQFGSAVGTAEWVLGVPFGSTRWSWCATSLALSVTTIFSSPGKHHVGNTNVCLWKLVGSENGSEQFCHLKRILSIWRVSVLPVKQIWGWKWTVRP